MYFFLMFFFFTLGALYGKGVYFAAKASYSARPQYSPADNNGYKYMYLTRVLVGEYTVGKKKVFSRLQ